MDLQYEFQALVSASSAFFAARFSRNSANCLSVIPFARSMRGLSYFSPALVHLLDPDEEYDELVKRDKASLDIFWLRDESLEDSENLPPPGLPRLRLTPEL